jgi:glutaredoxin
MAVPKLTIYTLVDCPNCEILKEFMKKRGIDFSEEDMSTAAALTELRVNGVFVNEAPVLRNGTRFLTHRDLFLQGHVREENVSRLVEGA